MCWEGGEVLANVVLQWHSLFFQKTVLELGAGCAPLPSFASSCVHAKRCIITDGCDSVLSLAKKNLERNRDQLPKETETIVQRLIWGSLEDVELVRSEENIDWILGADVVYSETGTRAFFQTVTGIMEIHSDAKLVIAYVVRGVSEGELIKIAKAAGLVRTHLPGAVQKREKERFVHLAVFEMVEENEKRRS